MTTFTIPQPNDMHLHVRQGDMTKLVVPHTAKQFGRAIIMPNTQPPITNLELAGSYQKEIMSALPENHPFIPMITFYISQKVDAQELRSGYESGLISAVKLYPLGVTTNSEHGASHVKDVYYILEVMEEIGMPLLIHGEDSAPNTDTFDREEIFYRDELPEIMADFPKLKIVCEHITTQFTANFVQNAPDNIAATITPAHLLCDRNDLLGKGLNPHLFCKPLPKRAEDKQALLDLVMQNTGRVFAGTDSAPHTKDRKESASGGAGVYSAYSAIELYAEAFDTHADLSKPETQESFKQFMSINAANFYGFDINTPTITLSNEHGGTKIPDEFSVGDGKTLVPYRSGETLPWSIIS